MKLILYRPSPRRAEWYVIEEDGSEDGRVVATFRREVEAQEYIDLKTGSD